MIPEIISATKTCNDITKGNQISFFNWIMVNFFGKHYLKYLVKKMVLEWTAEVEAEKQIATFAEDPHPMMALMRAEGELEYKNMFGVLQKALPKIIKEVPPNTDIILDKMKRLKDLSKEFSSEDMQELIASILAWEYNQPWSFSFKTLDIVRNLGKEDIELFRKFWGLVFSKKDFFRQLYGFDNECKVMRKLGIWYDNYLYLVELWLVWDAESVRDIWSDMPESLECSYEFDIQWKKITLKKKGKSKLEFSSLTTAWLELFPIIWFKKNYILLELVKSEFIRQWFYE